MNWSAMPFVRLLPFLISGILTSLLTSLSLPDWSIYSGLLLTVFLLAIGMLLINKYRYIHYCGMLLYTSVFLIGLGITQLSKTKTLDKPVSSTLLDSRFIIGDVIKPVEKKGTRYKAIIQINYYKLKIKNTPNETCIAYFNDSTANTLSYGDRVLLQTKIHSIEAPANPEEFNYKRYMALKGIHYTCFVNQAQWHVLSRQHGNAIIARAYSFRQQFIALFENSGLSDEVSGIATAFIIGNRSDIDKDLLTVYANTGILHIISVSGLHVGIIYLVLGFLLQFMNRNTLLRMCRQLLIVGIIWLYAFVTGLDSPVLRASMMITCIAVAELINRYNNTYNTVAASCFLLLLINPLWIADIGFQFSFLAVAGIITGYSWLHNQWLPHSKVLEYGWSMICVSLVAQLFTFPLGVYYFHQFPNYFLLANLVAMPLSTLIMIAGMLFALSSPILYLQELTGLLLTESIRFMNYLVGYIGSLPFAVTENIFITLTDTILLLLLIIAAMLFVATFRKGYFFAALITLLLLTISVSYRDIRYTKQQLSVAHKIKHMQSHTIINGQEAIVLTNDSSVTFKKKFNYHIKPLLVKHQAVAHIRLVQSK